MGLAVQQLMLDIVHERDPELSAVLHGEGHAPKPYTVSGLLTNRDRSARGEMPALWGEIALGQEAWVRLGGLNRDVMAILGDFAAAPPPTIDIDHHAWEVVEATWDHPWAGRTRYTELIRASMTASLHHKLMFAFASPTAFHSGGFYMPLPLPKLVFGSLLARWNTFTAAVLPEAVMTYVEHNITIEEHQIRTRRIHLKHTQRQVGFVGETVFSVNQQQGKLAQTDLALGDHFAIDFASLARSLLLLEAFAFYSGVGIKTTAGMGLVKSRLWCHDSN